MSNCCKDKECGNLSFKKSFETLDYPNNESKNVSDSHLYSLKLGLDEVAKGTKPDSLWVSSMRDALDVYEQYLNSSGCCSDDTLRFP